MQQRFWHGNFHAIRYSVALLFHSYAAKRQKHLFMTTMSTFFALYPPDTFWS